MPRPVTRAALTEAFAVGNKHLGEYISFHACHACSQPLVQNRVNGDSSNHLRSFFFLSSLKRCICSHPTCCIKELVCNKEFTWFRFTVTSLLKYRFAKLPPYSPNKHLQQVESCCLACVVFFFLFLLLETVDTAEARVSLFCSGACVVSQFSLCIFQFSNFIKSTNVHYRNSTIYPLIKLFFSLSHRNQNNEQLSLPMVATRSTKHGRMLITE